MPDEHGQVKVRGSAQRAFAEVVKANYEGRCAVTGISTPEFLVASHIVPWSVDQSIRLDPSNGICLSTLIDRAFDTCYLRITADATVELDRERLKHDAELLAVLEPYDDRKLRAPVEAPPAWNHLQRRYSTDSKSESENLG